MKTVICPSFSFNSKEELIFILENLRSKGFEAIAYKKDNRMDCIKQQIGNPEWYLKNFTYIIIEPEGTCYSNLPLTDCETNEYILKYEIVDFHSWISNN